MTSHRNSYWKTIILFAGATAVGVFLAVASKVNLDPPASVLASVVFSLLSAFTALVVVGGIVCLWRDSREIAGKPDLFAQYVNRLPSRSLVARLGLRRLQGGALRAGDVVQVNDLADIKKTLDEKGALEELPFMAEMEPFCGGVYQVYRRLDKIYDMRNKTGLRRVRNAVTLTDIRCSGAAHDGCQAECQIIWKEEWLTRLPHGECETVSELCGERTRQMWGTDFSHDEERTYFCQMTALWEASEKMSPIDVRPDLRALFSGNIGIAPFLLAMLTRLFNTVQRARGGINYPYMPPMADKGPTPTCELGLDVGDEVMIQSKQAIAPTLLHGRNKGLWYDRDMIRFSNQPATVRKRVSRVIDEETGKMVVMKTPCITLDRVVATGEFMRFCPQHEYILWREIWLQSGEDSGAASGIAPKLSN